MTTSTILLVSGSLRSGSTNTAFLRTAAALALPDVTCRLYDGLASLPAFNPDDDVDPLDARAADLRDQIRASDALLFSTPEYAGALPGSFKNLLDWTVGDGRQGSISEKPVAWVNVSSLPTGAANAHEQLRTVLGYVNAHIVDAACARIPVLRPSIGEDGLIADEDVRARAADVLRVLANRAMASA